MNEKLQSLVLVGMMATSTVAWAQFTNTANVKISTHVENPEHVFHFTPVDFGSRGYFVTKEGYATNDLTRRGRFAWFAGEEAEMYYLYNLDLRQWVAPVAGVPTAGKNKLTYVQDRNNARPWRIAREGNVNNNRFDVLPNKTTDLAWNFHSGVTSNTTSTIGLYSKTDANSSWAFVPDSTVILQDGRAYYLTVKNDADQHLYNLNGSLAIADTRTEDSKAFKFICKRNTDGTFVLTNLAGKYLGLNSEHRAALVDAPFNFSVYYNGFTPGTASFFRMSDKRVIVVKNDKTVDRAIALFSPFTSAYSTDIQLTEAPLPATRLSMTIPGNVGASVAWGSQTFTTSFEHMPYDTNQVSVPVMTATNKAYDFDGFYHNNTKLTTETFAQLLRQADAPLAVEARFILNIFTADISQPKWLRIKPARNLANAWTAENETQPTSSPTDLTKKEQLFAFVGNLTEGFQIISRKLGNNLYLNAATTPADNVGTNFSTTPQLWKMHDMTITGSTDKGYQLYTANGNWTLNSYGGATGTRPLKFHSKGDGGASWVFEVVDVEGSFITTLEGENPFPTNERIANFRITRNGIATTTIFPSSPTETKSIYLTAGDKLKVENDFIYRGYKLIDFEVDDTPQTAGQEFTIGNTLKFEANYLVDTNNKHQYMSFTPKNDKPYRIPAIATTHEGYVLNVSDYRPVGEDVGFGEVDIVARRSLTPGTSWDGKSWSEEYMIANGDGIGGNENVAHAFGDAAIVADRESGEVLIMSVGGKVVFWQGTSTKLQPVVRHHSSDNGQTWNWTNRTSEFYNGSNSIFRDTLYNVFFGSGRLIQSRIYKKDKYYRVYGGLNTQKNSRRTNVIVYSDDFGVTWHLLGSVPAASGNCDEPKVEELRDGSIILSSRWNGCRVMNIFHYTDVATGQGVWGTAKLSNVAGDRSLLFGNNATNGEILLVRGVKKGDQKVDLLLQSVPTAPTRANVSFFYKEIDKAGKAMTSDDLCTGWRAGLQVSNMNSAYSTMTLLPNGNIGFFYEESPGAYSMVYRECTIEEITNNAYSKGFTEHRVTVTGLENPMQGGVQYTGTEYAGTAFARTGNSLYISEPLTENLLQPIAIEGKEATVSLDTDGHITINYNTATGITTITAESATTPNYDLSGRRINSVQKGAVYLKKGNKRIK